MVEKTSRDFDQDSGKWTGYMIGTPNETVVCELWRLFFDEPAYPALDPKANKKAKEENESLRVELFKAAQKTAQAVYESQPDQVKTTLGHGVGRVVGDKLNTSKAKDDSGIIKECREVWGLLYSGMTRVSTQTADPFVISLRDTVKARLMKVFKVNQSTADKEARDSMAGAIGRLADAKKVDRKEYRESLEAYVREGLEG